MNQITIKQAQDFIHLAKSHKVKEIFRKWEYPLFGYHGFVFFFIKGNIKFVCKPKCIHERSIIWNSDIKTIDVE